jgi:inhibitor of KinA sporulation pathway (predicted exonuclease)
MSTPKSINVVDVEATCWETEPPNNTYEPRNEIIEVGITPIDIKTKEIGSKRSIIVLPKRTEISPFCTELTTLTPEYVEKNGVTFERMLTILREEYKADKNVWASFGDYDKDIFKRNCRQNGLKYPFSNYHLNVKSLFAAKN